MNILRRYGIGPTLHRLIKRYSDEQAVVMKSGKLFGRQFRTERGVKKGEPFSPTIFNIVVVVLVREILLEVCGPQEAHHGFVWAAGEHNTILYVDDCRIEGRKPIWVQTTLTAVVRMFKKLGLLVNIGNNKAMMCTPGFIWGHQGTAVYKRRAAGEGSKFRERKKTRVSCEEWRGDGGVVTPPPHEEETQDSHATDPGGRCWWRGVREIWGVLTAVTEAGGVPGR